MNIKKSIFILSFFFCSFGLSAQAYKSAVGVKAGDALFASYKTFLSEKLAFELYGGPVLISDVDLMGAAVIQLHFPIGSVENLTWFAGGGPNFSIFNRGFGASSNARLGITTIGGADYKFKTLPLNVSADIAPTYHFGNSAFYNFRIYGTVAARYVFGG